MTVPGRQRAAPLRHPAAAPRPLQAATPPAPRRPPPPPPPPGRPARRSSFRRPPAPPPPAATPAADAATDRHRRRRSPPPFLPARPPACWPLVPGDRAAPAAADRAAAAAGRRAGAHLPGRGEARRGGGDRGVAGLLPLRRAAKAGSPCRPTCSALVLLAALGRRLGPRRPRRPPPAAAGPRPAFTRPERTRRSRR